MAVHQRNGLEACGTKCTACQIASMLLIEACSARCCISEMRSWLECCGALSLGYARHLLAACLLHRCDLLTTCYDGCQACAKLGDRVCWACKAWACVSRSLIGQASHLSNELAADLCGMSQLLSQERLMLALGSHFKLCSQIIYGCNLCRLLRVLQGISLACGLGHPLECYCTK